MRLIIAISLFTAVVKGSISCEGHVSGTDPELDKLIERLDQEIRIRTKVPPPAKVSPPTGAPPSTGVSPTETSPPTEESVPTEALPPNVKNLLVNGLVATLQSEFDLSVLGRYLYTCRPKSSFDDETKRIYKKALKDIDVPTMCNGEFADCLVYLKQLHLPEASDRSARSKFLKKCEDFYKTENPSIKQVALCLSTTSAPPTVEMLLQFDKVLKVFPEKYQRQYQALMLSTSRIMCASQWNKDPSEMAVFCAEPFGKINTAFNEMGIIVGESLEESWNNGMSSNLLMLKDLPKEFPSILVDELRLVIKEAFNPLSISNSSPDALKEVIKATLSDELGLAAKKALDSPPNNNPSPGILEKMVEKVAKSEEIVKALKDKEPAEESSEKPLGESQSIEKLISESIERLIEGLEGEDVEQAFKAALDKIILPEKIAIE